MKSLDQKGVSLIELVVAMAVTVTLIIIISTVPGMINSIGHSRYNSIAKDIASMKIDSLRKVGYLALSLGKADFTASGLSSLPGGTANYEVLTCPIEICTDGENIKEVKVEVLWTEGKNSQKLSLVTLIGQGGIGQ